jgi:AraC-like DNA-binding protein
MTHQPLNAKGRAPKQEPRLMDRSQMQDILEPNMQSVLHQVFFNNELGIVHGDPTLFRLIMKRKPPFIINDHRMGIVVRGEADINFNLQDRHLKAGMLAYLGPGTIITPHRFTNDFEIYGVILFSQFPMPFAPGQLPSAFNGQVRDFQLSVSEDDQQTTRNIIDTLWQLVRQPDCHQPTVSMLISALMHHYDGCYSKLADQAVRSQSREQTIFDRFITLVNQYCCEHHQIGYYAERMCLTERYLNTVIRQTSGTTAKDWIDRALITHIKIALRHTDKPAAQIAEEMHFANPSFFSKYFRRLTGMTPGAFKAQSQNQPTALASTPL